jgi:hypothetical protein
MAVPFASHRETYSWLAEVRNQPFKDSLTFISSTYRPLAQAATWKLFEGLDPHQFPTSQLRQALLQSLIFALFLAAWWLIYTSASQLRVFAVMAFVTGGIFFAGYVHLFHLYGLYYVPVMFMLGALLQTDSKKMLAGRELWFFLSAMLLILWHPFATGLFLGYYFGCYLETFAERNRVQRVRGLGILALGTAGVLASVFIFPHLKGMSAGTRLFGFLVSYQTNEVNRIASFAAFALAEVTLLSLNVANRLKWLFALGACVLALILYSAGIPLLILWVGIVSIKLAHNRMWPLLFLTLAAAILPIGGGIGTPIYALFVIILSTYGTCLGWTTAEKRLTRITFRQITCFVAALALIIALCRLSYRVPVVAAAATPLLVERERTYQLENALAWLQQSEHCDADLAFAEEAGNPIESVASVIKRESRPPAALEDVHKFWQEVLRCRPHSSLGEIAIITFGGPPLSNSRAVYTIPGKKAPNTIIWIRQ